MIPKKVYESEEDIEQEIIEVSQTEAKQALKSLLVRQNEVLALMYRKHDDYNKRYFMNKLSVPLITIEKMSHKVLSSYSSTIDATGLENHIRLNVNFVALNSETRLLEALKREMIHQYQDEILYEKKPTANSKGHSGLKRPSSFHNKAFKDWAKKIGIVAKGRLCVGSPAHMPKAKSYNRKFVCGCKATNGYPLTVWSTREINAICQTCGESFKEVKKAGGLIKVSHSHVEKPGEDAFEISMKAKYDSFQKYKHIEELTEKVTELKELNIKYKEGIYPRGHNSYNAGFNYWIAYNAPKPTVIQIALDPEELKKTTPKKMLKGIRRKEQISNE